MSERLRELQRQRALAQEQVAWLDREIAQETQQSAAAPAPATRGADKPVVAESADHTANEILAQYTPRSLTTAKHVKRGCYLYFAFAMGAVVLFAVAVYFIYSRRP